MKDMVSFLARNEIVATGLLKFDDCPEKYRAWKASFPNTIRGLNLTAKEEFDLLLKWFGTKSEEHVKQIGAVHVNYPQQGLKMVWERLDDCYGASTVNLELATEETG